MSEHRPVMLQVMTGHDAEARPDTLDVIKARQGRRP
jgi:hypothetical protein